MPTNYLAGYEGMRSKTSQSG